MNRIPFCDDFSGFSEVNVVSIEWDGGNRGNNNLKQLTKEEKSMKELYYKRPKKEVGRQLKEHNDTET